MDFKTHYQITFKIKLKVYIIRTINITMNYKQGPVA